MAKKIIAEVKELRLSFKDFITKKQNVVIRDTGFKLYDGEILGIIGESGSGKSVITSTLNGINGESAKIEAGSVSVLGKDVTHWNKKEWVKSELRGKEIGKVFQNPMSALNPALKIRYQLIETLMDYKLYKTEVEAEEVVINLLKEMNIVNPESLMEMYPHELSGGMIQRVIITMVMAMKPKIIIFDEPTTALDPIVQAEILKIVKKLNKEYGISMIFITHDIGVIASVADRISVMYAGRIIETGYTDQILYNSAHPYTWGLLSSLPRETKDEKMEGIEGVLDMSLIKDEQDAFVFRNPFALEIDQHKRPPTFKVEDGHYAATWLLDPRAPKVKKPKFIIHLSKFYKPKGGK